MDCRGPRLGTVIQNALGVDIDASTPTAAAPVYQHSRPANHQRRSSAGLPQRRRASTGQHGHTRHRHRSHAHLGGGFNGTDPLSEVSRPHSSADHLFEDADLGWTSCVTTQCTAAIMPSWACSSHVHVTGVLMTGQHISKQCAVFKYTMLTQQQATVLCRTLADLQARQRGSVGGVVPSGYATPLAG